MTFKSKTIIKLTFTFLLSLGTAIVAAKDGINFRKADANEYEYVDDFSGIYKIVSHESDGKQYGLDIQGGNVSTTGADSPLMEVYQIANPVTANQRFQFCFVETYEDRAVYYITSCLDNNGRISAKGGTIADGSYIWYHGFTQDNAEKWSIRTSDGGRTYQIVNAYHPDLFLSYDSTNNLCILSNDGSDVKTHWNIELVVGEYGLNTKTYLVADNIGYAFTASDERWRYLEPNGNKGYISDIINVGVSGEGVTQTTFNNVKTFNVPYSSKFYIDTSFVYANSAYGEWGNDKELGKANSDGGYLTWRLSKDSWTFNSKQDSFSKAVNYGLYGIETSLDNKNWSFYRLMSFTPNNRPFDRWGIEGDLVASGIYIRISFMFEIYTSWEEGWWIFASTKYAYKNVREVSDSFYVCADGFGEEDFGILTISNNSAKNTLNDVDNGLTLEEKTFSETLVNGSLTTTGFTITSRYPSYNIEISKNDGEFTSISSGYSQTESGKYTIKATSRFGKTKQADVYVTRSEELVDTYFGGTFANKPDDVAFIQGTRILSGDSELLKSLGITLNYSYAECPVYKKGCELNVKSPEFTLPLSGNIYYQNTEGQQNIEVNTSNGPFNATLEETGYYVAELHTNNNIGDILSFRFTWIVVENSPGPVVNEMLIKSKTQETYDLVPTYYGVRVDEGRDIFKENGEPVEKIKSLYYAFASYDRAYNFALRVEKEYAMYKGDGVYSYKDTQDKLDEYSLFKLMDKNARANITKRYFARSDEQSMKIFTPYDEDGNVRKYDDGVNELTAYCLEQNTNQCVVTLDKVELAALTSRQPYINNFEFISVPLDSVSVTLTSEDNTVYPIEYEQKVGEQLEALEAKSGKYLVTETSVFGDINTYDVYYLKRNSQCDASVTLEIDNQEVVINKDNNQETLQGVTYFAIKSVVNNNDDHTLVLISKDNKIVSICDSASISDIFETLQSESGEYVIHIEDRMGNYFTYSINI